MISCGVKSDRISARTLNILNMRGFSEGKIRPQLIIGVVRHWHYYFIASKAKSNSAFLFPGTSL